MIKVNVEQNSKLWKNKIKNPKNYFKKKLEKVVKIKKFFKDKNITFTILLTNNLNMKKLNKKYRKINKSTDVLSFPNLQKKDLKLNRDKEIYVGDIAISYQIINFRGKKYNFFKEFDKAWIHGFLHLLGYRHFKNKDYFKMQKTEKKILNLFY